MTRRACASPACVLAGRCAFPDRCPEDAAIREHQIDEALGCVRRELAMRKRVYPRQVALGRMTPQKAAAEEVGMRAVLRLLLEMRHGHATAAYIAACEAYGVTAGSEAGPAA